MIRAALLAAGAAIALAGPAGAVEGLPMADEQRLQAYTIDELLQPCIAGANDARWGEEAERECEQYLRGAVDMYLMIRSPEAREEVCLPAQDVEDSVRRAFQFWAKQNWGRRTEPAIVGVMETLKAEFACE